MKMKVMKNKIMILGALLLLVMVTSCREESDAVQNYVFNDGQAFKEAKESYAGKFNHTCCKNTHTDRS